MSELVIAVLFLGVFVAGVLWGRGTLEPSSRYTVVAFSEDPQGEDILVATTCRESDVLRAREDCRAFARGAREASPR